MKTTVLTDVVHLTFDNGDVIGEHLLFGGGAVRTEKSATNLTLATVGSDIFEVLPADPDRQGQIAEVPFVEPAWRLTLRERRETPRVSVDLRFAERVVCAGRGLAQQEDLTLIDDLARALEAEVGCSRPIADTLGWLPVERYIGVSGVSIKPELCVTVGVSGQVQFTAGIVDARVVVAINKDKNAPIFKKADYGIVGDLYQIVPMLTEALKERD